MADKESVPGPDQDQDQAASKMETASEKNRDPSLSDSSSTAGSLHGIPPTRGEKDTAQHSKPAHSHHDGGILGAPDIGHEAVEHAVPGHDLDVELAQVSQPTDCTRW
jgi:hypothetical protein